jgi:hypothetical protein
VISKKIVWTAVFAAIIALPAFAQGVDPMKPRRCTDCSTANIELPPATEPAPAAPAARATAPRETAVPRPDPRVALGYGATISQPAAVPTVAYPPAPPRPVMTPADRVRMNMVIAEQNRVQGGYSPYAGSRYGHGYPADG